MSHVVVNLITEFKTIYHLLTETEGNSVFCGPETVDVSRGEAEGNIDGRVFYYISIVKL